MVRAKHTPNDPDRGNRIRQATIAVLQEHGIAAVTARAVAARANVPVGSVSYHYASVRALLLEAAETMLRIRAASLTQWADGVTAENLITRLAGLIHEQITTGRPMTVAAYELYLLGLRDDTFRAISDDATTALARELGAFLPPTTAERLATAADGIQLHSLFRDPPPDRIDLERLLLGESPRAALSRPERARDDRGRSAH